MGCGHRAASRDGRAGSLVDGREAWFEPRGGRRIQNREALSGPVRRAAVEGVELSFVPPALVAASVRLLHDVLPVPLPLAELTILAASFRKRIDALPVERPIAPLAIEASSGAKRIDALPVRLSLAELVLVAASVRPRRLNALPIRPPLTELTLLAASVHPRQIVTKPEETETSNRKEHEPEPYHPDRIPIDREQWHRPPQQRKKEQIGKEPNFSPPRPDNKRPYPPPHRRQQTEIEEECSQRFSLLPVALQSALCPFLYFPVRPFFHVMIRPKVAPANSPSSGVLSGYL